MPLQQQSMLASRGTLASRARYLAGNNALAASAVEAWVSALVGTGVKAQAQHPDDAIRAALNLAHELWTDEADADGLTDFYGLQALMVRRLVIDGELFAILGNVDDRLRIRVVEAEQVDGSLNRDLASGRIVQGVEFDRAGRRVAYHVYPERPGMPFAVVQQPVRIPAEDVAHLFRPELPGQVRGISWFAPVIMRMADLDGWRDAQLMRQRVAATLAGFVTTTDGSGAPFDGEQRGANLIGGLEPGTLKYLDPGQDIRFSTPANVGAEVIDFATLTEREIAVGLGLPASILTGDLSDVNYSSIRAGLVEWRRRIEALQHGVLAFQALRPIWRRWATLEVLSGRVETTVDAAMGVKFIVPKQQWVDPAKDVQAELDAIAGGLMSRREAVTSRGVDVEALDAEIAADNQRAASLGLTFQHRPAANQNQPPAAAA
ncbi:phage portal protein [Mesorhizobium sp. PUT5]|uniref:phage portal protein n=1 Tax=Mesorhizobium sp. PUT5 TaxID=3454629 RepID=UPI003FA44FD9